MNVAGRFASPTGMKILLGLVLVALLARAAYDKDSSSVRVFWIAAGIFALVTVIV